MQLIRAKDKFLKMPNTCNMNIFRKYKYYNAQSYTILSDEFCSLTNALSLSGHNSFENRTFVIDLNIKRFGVFHLLKTGAKYISNQGCVLKLWHRLSAIVDPQLFSAFIFINVFLMQTFKTIGLEQHFLCQHYGLFSYILLVARSHDLHGLPARTLGRP